MKVLLLIPQRDLLTGTQEDSVPDLVPQLAVWIISGSATRTVKFQRKLKNCSWHHGGSSPPRHTTHGLESGSSADVVNSAVIISHAL